MMPEDLNFIRRNEIHDGIIPQDFRDIIDKRNIAHFASLDKNNNPHTTKVWVDTSSNYDRLMINTTENHQKYQNIQDNPQVSISITDPNNPDRYIKIDGVVEKIVYDNAIHHLNQLSEKYLGQDAYPNLIEGQKRVKVIIKPEKIFTYDV